MLRTLFVFVILIPGLFAALRSRLAALLLYIWFALFRPQEWMWWDISVFRPSLLLGILVVVPSLLTGVFPYLWHPLSLGAVSFLLCGLLGQLNAFDPAMGWSWLDYLFRLIVICLLAVSLVSDQRRFKLTVAVIAGSLGFHAAKAGLLSLFAGGTRLYFGLAGAFIDNNGYAVGMVMIIPLLVATAQNLRQRWLSRMFYAAVPLVAIAVVSTFSRGGFLALTAAGLTLTLLQRRRLLALLAAATVAVPLVLIMTAQEGYVDRLKTIRTYEEVDEESALSRLHFWRVAVDMAMDHPLGVGLFNYEAAYDRYDSLGGAFGRQRSVHSSAFQVLAETGFLGAATFAFLFVCAFRCAFRIRRRGLRDDLPIEDQTLFVTAGNALIGSMVAFVVGGSFIAMALNDLTWLTFALVAALDRVSERCVSEAEAAAPVRRATSPQSGWRPVGQPAAI